MKCLIISYSALVVRIHHFPFLIFLPIFLITPQFCCLPPRIIFFAPTAESPRGPLPPPLFIRKWCPSFDFFPSPQSGHAELGPLHSLSAHEILLPGSFLLSFDHVGKFLRPPYNEGNSFLGSSVGLEVLTSLFSPPAAITPSRPVLSFWNRNVSSQRPIILLQIFFLSIGSVFFFPLVRNGPTVFFLPCALLPSHRRDLPPLLFFHIPPVSWRSPAPPSRILQDRSTFPFFPLAKTAGRF